MNIKTIDRIFGGRPETRPVCPQCGGREIGMNAKLMTCGSCDWYEPIDLESPHHTELTRYKVAAAMRDTNGERHFHYFLPEGLDSEDRNLAERRLFERCIRISSIREARDMVARLLGMIGHDETFRSTYAHRGAYPDELWIGAHGRRHDYSDVGCFVQDTNEGLFFRVGSFLHNADAVPTGQIDYNQMVQNIASGASWEIMARRRANYSLFVRMEKVQESTPIFGQGKTQAEGEPVEYRVTVSRYGFYPIHMLIKLDGWTPYSEDTSVVKGKSCEQLSVSNIHIDEDDIVGDDILMQPISWSAFRITGGPNLDETWAPRWASVLYSSRYLVTCGVSEDQDRGQFVARAAVRNTKEGNVVSLKKVKGDSIEECVENARHRIDEIRKLEEEKGEVFTMEKDWDVLDTDPLASLMELRNLTCWESNVGHTTMAKRTSNIFS